MLSDARIRELMLAHGFTVKDGLTDLKPYVFTAARAIESAATAPLLARIAELVNTIEKGKDLVGGMALKVAELEKWQAEHWNALEIINNYFVSKDLLLVVEDGGPVAAARNIVHSVAALEQQLEEARKVLKETGLLLHHFWCDVQMNDYSFDKLNKGIEAIDAAIKEQT